MPGSAPPTRKLAEPLRLDEVHLWSVPYARERHRAPLRLVLGSYLAAGIDGVELVEDSHGRPMLRDSADLRFNWSHSGPRALIALARGVQPGIDLECFPPRRSRDVLALARRFFAGTEATMLEDMPAHQRELGFLHLWTAKEAMLKAHGRGLAFGLDRVCVDISTGAPQLMAFAGDEPAAWQLHALNPGGKYIAALAWRGGPRTIRWMTPSG
ncbi:4'-phosphopantetheinyl transferase family protein [Dyella sp.]|jgi:4'-phosphopantetheinyl transferase|uniref:4'-phosphopantetheinyl transferase family protein n=1 Tax=Dyella sp. TaxID=1869338 RepID=UPI002D776DF5|nr:4'-phosphopantetheinyl transferase superfamily protein [Dyella sp.]HET6430919.1 4'-phosphopantetheinyl transferase superfamily protein [Dyella sp.]